LPQVCRNFIAYLLVNLIAEWHKGFSVRFKEIRRPNQHHSPLLICAGSGLSRRRKKNSNLPKPQPAPAPEAEIAISIDHEAAINPVPAQQELWVASAPIAKTAPEPLIMAELEPAEPDELAERPAQIMAALPDMSLSQSAQDLLVGEQLRRARTAQRKSLEEISEWLRIKPDYLAALEQSRYEALPAMIYAQGFLRSYAEYLGLDQADLRQRFQQEMADRLRPRLVMPQPLPEARIPPLPVIIGALLAVGLVYGAWTILQPSGVVPTPAVTAPALVATSKSSEKPPAVAAVPQTKPDEEEQEPQRFGAKGMTKRRLVALEDVWLTIMDDQRKVLFSQMLRQGDRYQLPDQAGLRVTTGNGAALQLEQEGRAAAPLGQAGRSLTDFALNASPD
jgi:cytoskeletal protein RodZ